MSNYVTAVENSRSTKLLGASATYAPIQSCKKDCPFLNKGCYAQLGNCAYTTNRISRNIPVDSRPSRIAKAEANAINELSGENPLRLHVVGDARTPKSAGILAEAAFKHSAKNNQVVWTYTRAWKEINREEWGDISVIASCNNMDEANEASERGYAVSTVRWKRFEKPFTWGKWLMQPCLSLTKGLKCKDCRMCMSDKTLRANNTLICFFPHGSQSGLVKEIVKNL